jgi:hypothetical protein
MKSQLKDPTADQANKICLDIKSSGAQIVAAKKMKRAAIKLVIDRSGLAEAIAEAASLTTSK